MDKVLSCTTSTGSYSQYIKEWRNSFSEDLWLEKLKANGVKGHLRDSCFRSICWKVFLECFPENPAEWADAANEARQNYENILDKLQTNPWCNVSDMDLHMNHPLSQSSKSSWYNYFQDSELKLAIQQDVVRTFPEIKFFRSTKVQTMMINILFCYAREYPNICYRQGMHELLAPIIYVLHMDQENYKKFTETESVPLDICILLNQNYTEHDAFFLFCQLMEAVEGWYVVPENHAKYRSNLIREPFTRPLDDTQSNTLGIKLTKIQENHLRRHDPQLYTHLDQMEIAPQIYGIRWMRLLFGREFSLPDLLVVWDAIFATSLSFDLVEYIFTAMLICVRDLLLQSDYTSCLGILMHYPEVENINCIIDLALHLKDPAVCCKPSGLFFDVQSNSYRKSLSIPDFTHNEQKPNTSTSYTNSQPKSLGLKISNTELFRGSLEEALEVSETDIPIYKTAARSSGKDSSANKKNEECSKKQLRLFMSNDYPENESIPFKNRKGWPSFRRSAQIDSKNFPAKEMVLIKENLDSKCYKKHDSVIDLMENMDIRDINMKLHQLISMNKFCFDQMSFHLDKLKNYLDKKKGLDRTVIDISLNGLQEVQDILKKSMSLNQDHALNVVQDFHNNSNETESGSVEKSTNLVPRKVLNKCPNFSVSDKLESENIEKDVATDSQTPLKQVLVA